MTNRRITVIPFLCLAVVSLACAGLQPGAAPTATPTIEPSTGTLFDFSQLSIDPSIDPSKLPVTEGKGRIEDGFVIVPLTVQNDTGAPVRSVFVKAEVFDANGALIHVDAFSLDSYRLQPGEVGYGEYLRDVQKINGQPSSWKFSIAGAYTAQSQYHAAVENVAITDLGGGFADLAGTLSNDGSGTCATPFAVLAIYENGSELYRVDTLYPDNSADLPAGESVAIHDRAVPIPPGQVRIDVSGSCDYVDGE